MLSVNAAGWTLTLALLASLYRYGLAPMDRQAHMRNPDESGISSERT
jgi:hypothetical protein